MARLLVIIYFSGLKRDSLTFLTAAEKIAAGDRMALASQHLQPLYPILLSLGCKIGFPQTFGYFLNMVCAVCVMCCAYHVIASMLKSRAAGYCAMFFCALHPLLVEMDTTILRDSSYLCLFALSVVLTMNLAKNDRRVDAALLGAVCGAAPLLREEGWEFAFYFLIFCLLSRYGRILRLENGKITFRSILICFAVMFAVYLFGVLFSSVFGYHWFSNFSHQALFWRYLQ